LLASRSWPSCEGAQARPATAPRLWRRCRFAALMAAAGAEEVLPVRNDVDALAFRAADSNADGRIGEAEYFAYIRAGMLHHGLSGEEQERRLAIHRRLFDRMDIDGDGTLTMSESEYGGYFVHLLDEPALLEDLAEGDEADDFGDAELLAEFKRADRNGDWVVDRDEFSETLRYSLAELGVGQRIIDDFVQDGLVRAAFGKADATGDGVLNEREFQFVAWLTFETAAGTVAGAMFNELDEDLDGSIDAGEVRRAVGSRPVQETGSVDEGEAAAAAQGGPRLVDFVGAAFSAADGDGDGRLGREEAALLAESIIAGEVAPEL